MDLPEHQFSQFLSLTEGSQLTINNTTNQNDLLLSYITSTEMNVFYVQISNENQCNQTELFLFLVLWETKIISEIIQTWIF